MGEQPPAVRLNTHLWNPTGRRRALLLHGLGSDGTSWWRLASELATDGWMVLAPDLRSHGLSPPGADHRIAAFAADVALLGDRWELLVGHSLGGAVAAHLLAEQQLAPAAVLVDPVLHLTGDDHRRLRVEQRLDVGELDTDAVAEAHPAWHPRDVSRKVLAARRVTPDVVDAVLDDNDPWDVRADGDRWRERVHLLVADPGYGGWLAPATADELTDGTRVTAEVVPGAGHSIHRERPEVLARAVARVTATDAA
ncbi:alpha/beta fold hydrolase [Egicoccus halophilus]|uniref:AB hydrolase-1 domain-containing protein n=1 Tax=Egicoccus halophilus TaxID=1670830 RepID=A0A8J3A7W8_9ACTN|nr:alpha/beta fold hydrolase [Egicoccus halophilus]GGI03821.1 hypothetical protein GCM10011354_05960 [Egicoccus halophilus]